jgi:hypothetical protein
MSSGQVRNQPDGVIPIMPPYWWRSPGAEQLSQPDCQSYLLSMTKDDPTANVPPVELESPSAATKRVGTIRPPGDHYVTDPIEDMLRSQAQTEPERRATNRLKEEAKTGRRWSFFEKAALFVFGAIVGWAIKALF